MSGAVHGIAWVVPPHQNEVVLRQDVRLAFLPGSSWLAFDIGRGRFVELTDLLLVVLHGQIEGSSEIVNEKKGGSRIDPETFVGAWTGS